MKPLCEIANEYERNIQILAQRRDELREQMRHEPCKETQFKISQRIVKLDGIILCSERDVSVMRRQIRE